MHTRCDLSLLFLFRFVRLWRRRRRASVRKVCLPLSRVLGLGNGLGFVEGIRN
jgi:hypothetical protein